MKSAYYSAFLKKAIELGERLRPRPQTHLARSKFAEREGAAVIEPG